mgnify:CR=1 FL=1
MVVANGLALKPSVLQGGRRISSARLSRRVASLGVSASADGSIVPHNRPAPVLLSPKQSMHLQAASASSATQSDAGSVSSSSVGGAAPITPRFRGGTAVSTGSGGDGALQIDEEPAPDAEEDDGWGTGFDSNLLGGASDAGFGEMVYDSLQSDVLELGAAAEASVGGAAVPTGTGAVMAQPSAASRLWITHSMYTKLPSDALLWRGTPGRLYLSLPQPVRRCIARRLLRLRAWAGSTKEAWGAMVPSIPHMVDERGAPVALTVRQSLHITRRACRRVDPAFGRPSSETMDAIAAALPASLQGTKLRLLKGHYSGITRTRNADFLSRSGAALPQLGFWLQSPGVEDPDAMLPPRSLLDRAEPSSADYMASMPAVCELLGMLQQGNSTFDVTALLRLWWAPLQRPSSSTPCVPAAWDSMAVEVPLLLQACVVTLPQLFSESGDDRQEQEQGGGWQGLGG